MKDKKNIDNLFQSQLGNFEATPSPEVWDRIEAQLKKDKDRKVIPLWWRLGGVAALLAILLMVGNLFFVNDPNQIEIVEQEINPEKVESKEFNDDVFPKSETEIVSTPENPTSDKPSINTDKELHSDKTNNQLTEEIQNNSIVEEQTSIKEKTKRPTATKDITPSDKGVTGITKADQKRKPIGNEKDQGKTKAIDVPSGVLSEKTEVAVNNVPTNRPDENKAGAIENSKITTPTKAEEVVGIATQEDIKEEPASEVAPEKKSIFDAIEEAKEATVATVEENPNKGWEVTPNVGPVYYSSLSGGSSIDPAFSDNSQSGEVNFSYGINVAYNVNDRLSIRSGVNNVNLAYATGGIEVASAPVSFALKSVDYQTSRQQVLTVFDKGTIPMMVDPNDPYAQINVKSTTGNAELRQSITYYEIPLEAKYNLLNKRFGINMIGGLSTLLLSNSEVSVNDQGFRSVLGEANNLNNVSFTTNVGLGFDYKISKRFKFNIEPMFKYQLNPYTDSSVDFKPYYFGIYSGLSFKF